jgi:integrase
VEEIIAVMRAAGQDADGARLRALIVILWRAGLRIGEALGRAETDLDASRGAVLVRRGRGGRRREVGMDRWAWSQLEPWMALRRQLPVVALLCVIRGATAGRPPGDLRSTPTASPPPCANPLPTQSMTRSLAELPYRPHIQHANLGITSIYLQGIDSSEIIHAVHSRPAPVIPATAGLESMR